MDELDVDGTAILLYRNATLQYSSKAIQGDFTFDLGIHPGGSVLELTISVEDEYGNTNTTIITIFVDRETPEFVLNSKDNLGNLLGSNIFHDAGTYQIVVNDDHSTTSEVEIMCQNSAENDLFFFNQSFTISQENLKIQNCGDFFTITVESQDAVGNKDTIQQVVEIDRLDPEILIESSCPIGNKSKTVLLPSCTLKFGASDDTSHPVQVTAQFDGLEISDTPSVELNLSTLSAGETHEIIISLVDSANRESRTTLNVYIQPNLNISVSEMTCTQEHFDCETSPHFIYDYLITGNVSLNIEIPANENYSELVETTGRICPESNNDGCLQPIESYPFVFQPEHEGYWNWTFSGTDDLGRVYETTKQLLVDLGGLQVGEPTIYPTHSSRTNDVVLICETCKYTVTIQSHHKPHIVTNAGSWSLTQINNVDDAWYLEIDTNSESLPPLNTRLELRITSAAAHSDFSSIDVLYPGQTSIKPTISTTKFCSDNPEFVENTGSEQHFLCLYNKEDLNSNNSLELDLRTPNSLLRVCRSDRAILLAEYNNNPQIWPIRLRRSEQYHSATEVLTDSAGQLMIYQVDDFY